MLKDLSVYLPIKLFNEEFFKMSQSRDAFFSQAFFSQRNTTDLISGYLSHDTPRLEAFTHSRLHRILHSDFKETVARRNAEMAPLIEYHNLRTELKANETLLEEKERKLHAVRRSTRDTTLDDILGDLGLPGGVATSVKGIAIGYDKVAFGEKDIIEGTSHRLEDAIQTPLVDEITTVRNRIAELTLQIFQLRETSQQKRETFLQQRKHGPSPR